MLTDPRALMKRVFPSVVALLLLSLFTASAHALPTAPTAATGDTPDLGPIDWPPDYSIAAYGKRVIVGDATLSLRFVVSLAHGGNYPPTSMRLAVPEGILLVDGPSEVNIPALKGSEHFVHTAHFRVDGAPTESFVQFLFAKVVTDTYGGNSVAIAYAPMASAHTAVQGENGAAFANTPTRGEIIVYSGALAPGTTIAANELHDYKTHLAASSSPSSAVEERPAIADGQAFTPTNFVFLPRANRAGTIPTLRSANLYAYQIIDVIADKPLTADWGSYLIHFDATDFVRAGYGMRNLAVWWRPPQRDGADPTWTQVNVESGFSAGSELFWARVTELGEVALGMQP